MIFINNQIVAEYAYQSISYENLLESILETNTNINNALYGYDIFISESYEYGEFLQENAILDACSKVVDFLKGLFKKFVGFIKGVFNKIKSFFTGGKANIKKEKAIVEAKEKIAKSKGEKYINVSPTKDLDNDSTSFTMKDGDEKPESREDVHNRAEKARAENRENRDRKRLLDDTKDRIYDLENSHKDVSIIMYDPVQTLRKCANIMYILDNITEVANPESKGESIDFDHDLADTAIKCIRDNDKELYNAAMAQFKEANKTLNISSAAITKDDNDILKNRDKWDYKKVTMKKTVSNYKESLSSVEKMIDKFETLSEKINGDISKYIKSFQVLIHTLDQSLKYLKDGDEKINAKALYNESSQIASSMSRVGSKLTNTIASFVVRVNKAQVAEIHNAFSGKVAI